MRKCLHWMSYATAGLAVGFACASSVPAASVGVPGVVIDYSPASSGLYIGSPSLAVLTNGDYVASHDFFGPKSGEHESAQSRVFRSEDRGATWILAATIQGQFWSKLFVHRSALYFLGTDRHHGNAIIRRSTDGGATWTSPRSSRSGLLREDGQYHCAPMPVLEHNGRLWRAMERRDPPNGWGITYRAGVLSVPVEADLLDANQWLFCEFLPGRTEWLNGGFGGWLEGNVVVNPEGRLVNVLRVDTPDYPEQAAIVEVSADGRKLSFDPETGFVDFPGGAKKFAIRYDEVTGRYWTLATIVPPARQSERRPSRVRNTLGLTSSPDLRAWEAHRMLLRHPDVAKHGFQYVDWQFEGDDLIAACRTAFDDGKGGANNAHDANYLTFHRIESFRDKTLEDSPETDFGVRTPNIE